MKCKSTDIIDLITGFFLNHMILKT